MWLFIAACAVFLASLGGMIVMAVRKFPVLASLNVHDEGEAREGGVRAAILEQRLRREFFASLASLRTRLTPLFGWLKARAQRIRAWAVALEARYQRTLEEERARVFPEAAKSPDQLIGEAAALMEKGDMPAAEAALLKAVALAPRSATAFKMLARLYTLKREYDHVREVDEFLLKLDPHQADVYADLGAALVALGDPLLALDAVEKAVAIEEGNPKYLDQLIDLAILLKRRTLAQEILQLLEEANPENEKIPVFAERIHELPRA